MGKKKIIILLIQVILFSALLFLFTEIGGEPFEARMTLDGISLILGLVFLKFAQPIAGALYKRQIETVKQKSSIEKFCDGVKHGGLLLSCLGGILILIGLVLK